MEHGAILEIPITSIKDDIFDLSNFNKINNAKLIGSYVNDEGKEIAIEKTIQTRLEWTKQITAYINQATKTFIPYKVAEEQGTILQTVVTVGIENNALPIKQTNIKVQVPEINGTKPEEVIVTSNSLKATNGKDGQEFSSTNYTYDIATGVINIIVENNEQENKVSWLKDTSDEYVITYKFEEKMPNITAEQTAEVAISCYNNVQTEVKNAHTLNIEESEIKGNFIRSKSNIRGYVK